MLLIFLFSIHDQHGLECANVRAPFSSSFIFFNFLVTFATLQNLPMTNITFDGVRVLGAESEQKASYHTCTGKY